MTPTEACRCPACVAAAGVIADKCGLTMVEAHDLWDRIDSKTDAAKWETDITAALAPYGVGAMEFLAEYRPRLDAVIATKKAGLADILGSVKAGVVRSKRSEIAAVRSKLRLGDDTPDGDVVTAALKALAGAEIEDGDGNVGTVGEASALDDPRAVRMWALECAADIEDGIAQVLAAAAMIEDFILNGMPKARERFDA